MTVVMTTHEPTHALAIADRALLLHGSGAPEEGSAAEVCTAERLTRLYGMPMKRVGDDGEADVHVVADYGAVVRRPSVTHARDAEAQAAE